eukprot:gb/GECG01011773.1/.p1 GENE.gb/GECG01011773.1/~~gb/GECG01011773.1/.p1  ORF type:complete len:749 (+),score=66.59 gb/GECG01011773.1/:1-2247(+)
MLTGNKRDRASEDDLRKGTTYGLGRGGTGLGSLGGKPRSELFTFQKTPRKTYGSRMHKSAIMSPPSRGAPKVKKIGIDNIKSPTGAPVATYQSPPRSNNKSGSHASARAQQCFSPLRSANYDRQEQYPSKRAVHSLNDSTPRKLHYNNDVPSDDTKKPGASSTVLHSPMQQKDPSVTTETTPTQNVSQRLVAAGLDSGRTKSIDEEQEASDNSAPSNPNYDEENDHSCLRDREKKEHARRHQQISLVSQAGAARKQALQAMDDNAPLIAQTSSSYPDAAEIDDSKTPETEQPERGTGTISRFFSPLKSQTPDQKWHRGTSDDPLSNYSKPKKPSPHRFSSFLESYDKRSDVPRKSSFDAGPTITVVLDSEATYQNDILEKTLCTIGAGLINRQNTCFMNSCVQCLAYSRWFLRWLKEYENAAEMLPSEKKFGSQMDINRELAFLLRRLRSQSSDTAIIPQRMLDVVPKISRDFTLGLQQDAQEFFCRMLDSMEQQSKRQGLPVCNLFEGKLTSRVVCSVCNSSSDTTDPFVTLSLGIHQCNTLSESLSYFFAAETLDGENSFECSKCKERVKAEKRIYFQALPDVLAVHLKRFHSYASFGKDDSLVKYPEAFNLFDRLSPDRRKGYERGTATDQSALERRNCWYELSSILVHRGFTVHSGHYYSFVRMKESNDKANFWNIDDKHVSTCSRDKAMNQPVYMLFYERCSAKQGEGWEQRAVDGTIWNIEDLNTEAITSRTNPIESHQSNE